MAEAEITQLNKKVDELNAQLNQEREKNAAFQVSSDQKAKPPNRQESSRFYFVSLLQSSPFLLTSCFSLSIVYKCHFQHFECRKQKKKQKDEEKAAGKVGAVI